ncbi:aldo/keto reductase [Nocardioides iriomotensis]|uniref:Aldo/keto reductase n=1 Tax=Nocardioides iriomotensis TaxID=715784 RepID=A0A4Q5J1J1_9ACTN|nr:aldo/keto reductase [Nocardioides iriomotensis]RYU12382.1 aldo/keto reductase [Nocardioides iriomotensis]
MTLGTWRLGEHDVRRIGFGAKRLYGDRGEVLALLRRVVELGVNHIDTATFYPSQPAPELGFNGMRTLGWANAMLREALSPYPEDLLIATKVGPVADGMARPDQLRDLVLENLRDLGRDHLDLVYLRQHGLPSIAEHLGVLVELRDEGLLRHIGLSNVRAPLVDEAVTLTPVAAVSNRYGVDFGRANDDLLRSCGERGIAFVPFFALAGEGREAGGVATTDAVRAVAARHGATEAQVRLAWTLAQGAHVLAIPGTGNPDHLVENLAAGDLALGEEDLALLG